MQDFTIASVVRHKVGKGLARAVVAVNEMTPLAEVLEILKRENILSVPIYKSTPDHVKVYTAIVSVHDILEYAYFQEVFDQDSHSCTTTGEAAMNRFKMTTFFSIPIHRILQKRAEPRLGILSSSDSLLSLVQLCSAGMHHRVLVLDTTSMVNTPNGPVPTESTMHLISQTDVLDFLNSSRMGMTLLPVDIVSNILDHKLEGMVQDKVISINEHQPALAAFTIMHQSNVHAIPVLNSIGTIIASFSASDLRGLTADSVERLLLPACQFLNIDENSESSKLLLLDLSEPVSKAIELMLANHVHHVWVTGKDSELKGVVTMTDILMLFC